MYKSGRKVKHSFLKSPLNFFNTYTSKFSKIFDIFKIYGKITKLKIQTFFVYLIFDPFKASSSWPPKIRRFSRNRHEGVDEGLQQRVAAALVKTIADSLRIYRN